MLYSFSSEMYKLPEGSNATLYGIITAMVAGMPSSSVGAGLHASGEVRHHARRIYFPDFVVDIVGHIDISSVVDSQTR